MTTKYFRINMINKPIDIDSNGLEYVFEGYSNKYTIQSYGTGNVYVYGSLWPKEDNIWVEIGGLTNNDALVFGSCWLYFKIVADPGVQVRMLEHGLS